MDKFFYIGIDPGQSGAIAVIDSQNNIIQLKDWPGDEIQAAKIVQATKKVVREEKMNLVGAIEYCHAMPKQGVSSMFKFGTNYGIWMGVSSMFKFGTNYGIWMGILAALDIPFYVVTPAKWQKGVIKKAQDKKPALAAAARIFPKAELYGPRGGGKDGRADALLIAYWCKRQ
jgi:crossover junction endodeoxyribonuclease RuvC